MGNTTMLDDRLKVVLAEGEGQRVEFKRGLGDIAPAIVAFANASGGAIFVGVDDTGAVAGVDISNRLLSEIQDTAASCDPPVGISLVRHTRVVEVVVREGRDKPYRCKDGFFLRVGPNSQKLRRNEIREMIVGSGTFHWDEQPNSRCPFPGGLDPKRIARYVSLAHIDFRGSHKDLLINMDMVVTTKDTLSLTNAGVLFFSADPQRHFAESGATAVRYQGTDRHSVVDRQEIAGDPIDIIESCLAFVRRNTSTESVIAGEGRRSELHEYPLVAVREAIVNAVTHRDYHYDLSHTYVHVYSDRMEIENPGGLPPGMSVDDLGRRSVRRNRAVADLLYRAGYVERVGSGIDRMKRALADNGNPPLEVVAGNFFLVQFRPRVRTKEETDLTPRQRQLLQLVRERVSVKAPDAATQLGSGKDTTLRELSTLIRLGLVRKHGIGKSTQYRAADPGRSAAPTPKSTS
jgi:ATP-dependent DNA helicase RecG